MAYKPETLAFFKFLQNNPAFRSQIRAGADKTLLYAGTFMTAMWKDIEMQRQTSGRLLDKQILPEVLAKLPAPTGATQTNLRDFVQDLEKKVPWQPDGFTIWRVLSGIFASNAVGKVSFMIGDGVTPQAKVFAATEIGVLARNPKVDPVTKDLVAYYQRCVQTKQPAMNLGFISA
jgi:hypothetical protein